MKGVDNGLERWDKYNKKEKSESKSHEKKEKMAKSMKFKHDGKQFDLKIKKVKQMPKPRFNMGKR